MTSRACHASEPVSSLARGACATPSTPGMGESPPTLRSFSLSPPDVRSNTLRKVGLLWGMELYESDALAPNVFRIVSRNGSILYGRFG